MVRGDSGPGEYWWSQLIVGLVGSSPDGSVGPSWLVMVLKGSSPSGIVVIAGSGHCR